MKESNIKSHITSHTYSKVLYKLQILRTEIQIFKRIYFVYLIVLLYNSWCGAEWEDQGITSAKFLLCISLYINFI